MGQAAGTVGHLCLPRCPGQPQVEGPSWTRFRKLVGREHPESSTWSGHGALADSIDRTGPGVRSLGGSPPASRGGLHVNGTALPQLQL